MVLIYPEADGHVRVSDKQGEKFIVAFHKKKAEFSINI